MTHSLNVAPMTIAKLQAMVKTELPGPIIYLVNRIVERQSAGEISDIEASKEIEIITWSCTDRQRHLIGHWVKYYPPTCQNPEKISFLMLLPQ